jgi:dolichol-phosphate mannosyltransferase
LVTARTLVIVPTYNEAANITDVIQRLKLATPDVDILIVDDNSPDGTGALADSLTDNRTHVLHRPDKGGLGPAYLAGFSWGYKQGYEYFVEMDADGSHQPEEISRFLAVAPGRDLVIGTRWMPGGLVVNWPISRRLISRFGTRYAAVALGLSFRDLTSGYRLLSRQLIQDVLDSHVTSIGYGFQIEIVRIAINQKRTIAEVPITFIERVAGSSKMSRKIVLEAWRKTTFWGFQRILNRR